MLMPAVDAGSITWAMGAPTPPMPACGAAPAGSTAVGAAW